MLMGIALILLCLLFFNFCGYMLLSDKKNLMTVTVVGALIFFGGFELISLFFTTFHLHFKDFLVVLLMIIILLSIVLFKNHQQYFNYLGKKLKNKYVLYTCIIAVIFGLVLAIWAKPYVDSWLYAPMSLSSIDNNLIYSNNGHQVDGKIISFHFIDGYYLFQAVIVFLTGLDHFAALLIFPKLLEGILIIFAIAMVCENLFIKRKFAMFSLLSVFMICGIKFFSLYLFRPETRDHNYLNMAIGINLINNLAIYVLIFIMLRIIKIKNTKLTLLFLVSGCFFLTSSSIFILPAFFSVICIYNVIIGNKQSFLNAFYALVVSLSFGIFYIINNMTLVLILILIAIIIIWLMMNILQRLTLKSIRIIGIIGSCSYFLFIFVYLTLTKNWDKLSVMFSFNQQLIYGENSSYYFNFYSPMFLVLFLFGCIVIYYVNKSLLFYIILVILIWANPVATTVFGNITSNEVYHRIFNLFIPNVVMMYFCYACLVKYKNIINVYVLSIGLTILLILKFPPINIKVNGFSNLAAFRYQSQDLYELAHYNFANSKNVNFGKPAKIEISGDLEMDSLLKTRGDLTLVDCNTTSPYYLITKKEQKVNLPPVFSTQNYNVYYVEHGGCMI